MRGIAAARAQTARNQLVAVDAYAQIVAGAVARALRLRANSSTEAPRRGGETGIALFCAEQGFAGAFNERALDAVGADLAKCELFLIGSRGVDLAAQRKIHASWSDAMPSHGLGVPKLADRITEALYRRIACEAIVQFDVAYTAWAPGKGFHVERHQLFPLDPERFSGLDGRGAPLVNLPPDALVANLAADYLHAQLCHAALHSFAAENQARMEAMAAAGKHVEKQLAKLHATERRVRQDEITDEIIELAAGETASRADRNSAARQDSDQKPPERRSPHQNGPPRSDDS
ncbi:F0F1 ATP synthase subunit gamma [Rhodoblastus sp.]|uniref:F0F1 ATP synthase subunit gamma n=1 Tax=Rhodoblastus sp. TaxID=1962975 RepID=UPI0025E50418|nr:F0F1 ATP synthase subunit gamma [Rhodoblastus sp.]